MSVVMSAESAQRLKARAAESGLHQSDSGLASESQWLSEPNVVIVVVSFCLDFADGMPKYTACQARRLSYQTFIVQRSHEAVRDPAVLT